MAFTLTQHNPAGPLNSIYVQIQVHNPSYSDMFLPVSSSLWIFLLNNYTFLRMHQFLGRQNYTLIYVYKCNIIFMKFFETQ